MPNDAAPETPARDDELLASLGLRLDGPGSGPVRAACTTIARRIRGARDGTSRTRVIGFVPSNDKVAVPPLLVHLGLALCDLSGATVAVVDANVRYPALGRLAAGDRSDHDNSVFRTRWLRGSLALLSAPCVEHAGDVVPQLSRVLHEGSDLFAHVLVDLTGFDLLGEHATAAALMDGVALVGNARGSREQELVELARAMPHGRFLGVLLVG